jgi:TRAP-type C4-dicarboxylate transport system permease small subunit
MISGRPLPLLRALALFEQGVTVAAFAVLIVVIFSDVLWRWVTGSGLFWARELGVYANIILTIVGIGVASSHGAHLRPRFFDGWVPARHEATMTRLQEALTALAFLGLAWVAWRVVAETIELDDRSVVLRWAVWPIQLVLPLAFVIGTLRHGLYALWPEHRPVERSEADVDLPAAAAPIDAPRPGTRS